MQQFPDTLVISGGGADGISFIGALEVLEKTASLSKLRNIVGCSVGSIVAVMLAMGMRSSQMTTWLREGIAQGVSQLDRTGILHITSTLGIDDGARIIEHIRSAIRVHLGPSYENPTMREFTQATGINITIVVTNVNTAMRELLNVDTAPDIPVLTAVRMSIAVPMVFSPVLWRNNLYVDGALIDCCPTAHIQTSGDATNVIVLNIQVPLTLDGAKDNGDEMSWPSLMEYGRLLCRVVFMRQHVIPCNTQTQNSMPRPTIMCTINIQSKVSELTHFNLRTMQLEISQESIDAFITHGRKCAHAQLQLQILLTESAEVEPANRQ